MSFSIRLRQLPFYGLLALVTYLSTLPSVTTPDFDNSDKILHFLAYLGIAGTAYFAFPKAGRGLTLFIILWGVGLELVQWQMPSRTFDLLDVLANSLGCLAGQYVMPPLLYLWQRYIV